MAERKVAQGRVLELALVALVPYPFCSLGANYFSAVPLCPPPLSRLKTRLGILAASLQKECRPVIEMLADCSDNKSELRFCRVRSGPASRTMSRMVAGRLQEHVEPDFPRFPDEPATRVIESFGLQVDSETRE